jgi:HK97 family phage portal protein
VNRLQKFLANITGVDKIAANLYNQSVFKFLNDGSVIWMPDNPEGYIKDGYYTNPDVYAAIQTIVNLATVAPLNLYRVKPDQKKAYQKYKSLCAGIPDANNLQQRSVFKTKALEEVDSHKILDRLNKPNEYQTLTEFLANIYGFRLATGNFYIYKAKSEVGTPEVMKLYILPTQYMNIESGGIMSPVKKYIYNFNATKEGFTPDLIIHNRTWSLDYSYAGSHLFGISPLKAARRSITMSNDGRTAQTTMLKNTGAKGLLAMNVKESGLAQSPTREQLQQIKDDFREDSGGMQNIGKVNVSVGKFEWFNMGMSAVDLSILESAKWSQQDICKVFGISPVILGDLSASTDNNYKHAKVSAITNAVIPLLRSVADSLNNGLVTEFDKNGDYVLDFDLSVYSELQEDLKSMVDYLEKAWWLTPNQKLTQMSYGESVDPNMNKIYLPASLMTMDDLNAPKDLDNLPLSGDY